MDFKNGKVEFGTKADTLNRIKPFISLSEIPESYSFYVYEWRENPEKIRKNILDCFGETNVIVRSSAYSEDKEDSTKAGAHTSKGNIFTGNSSELSESIEEVVLSYKNFGDSDNAKDQVLVQLMIYDVSMSGVVFTQDMKTGAPYYVINYDDQTGRTDTVTSGGQYSNKTLFVQREAVNDLHSPRFKALLAAVREIEEATEHDSLDIEFAVSLDNKVRLFQVRKITTRPNWNRGITLRVNDAIGRIRSFVSDRFRPMTDLYGSRSIFGQMPDWNPVEMIGITPRPLALSLYRYLITDRAWRIARKQMGYAEPKGRQLMVSLSGHPYIDVRLSFHSFLPKDLSPLISNKLVDAWLSRLSEHKELHDKIEFEVAVTALTFNFEQSVAKQFPGKLTSSEKESFRLSLFHLTNNLLAGKIAPIEGELRKIEQLKTERDDVLKNYNNGIAAVSALLEDCLWHGIVPFSILARHAFISQSFLRSIVDRGAMDESEIFDFQSSIKTVAGDMAEDIGKLREGKLEPGRFMDNYGHLRPGTYDILSARYDQRVDLLNGFVNKAFTPVKKKGFLFTSKHLKEVGTLLCETGYKITAEELFSYIRSSISVREYAKFIFSKNISDALEIISNWGERIGLSKEELSFLTIHDILDAVNVAEGRTLEQYLRDKSLAGRQNYEITVALKFPYIIDKAEDVSIIPLLLNRPNFITNKTVRAPYVFFRGQEVGLSDITGKIVLIEGADPGFDWIFSCSLVGLITKYGGANSHMAIRCAEFELPAAIGCGEQLFDMTLRSPSVELNCADGRIIPVEG